jgi:hypothetical protein
MMKIPAPVTQAYTNTLWAKYNEGLTRLTEAPDGHGKGTLKIAKGCGHFIQKDDPAFVASEINSMLDDILARREV